MTTGVNDRDNHRTVRLLKVINGKVALGDQGPVVIVKLHGKTPRIEDDLIRCGEITFEELVSTAEETSGKVIIGELHILADLLQRDNRLTGHL